MQVKNSWDQVSVASVVFSLSFTIAVDRRRAVKFPRFLLTTPKKLMTHFILNLYREDK